MKIDKLKVRPRKAAAAAPCATEFASVLACWASSQDFRSQSQCREAARALQTKAKPTINYHLARYSKRV
ncbi:hypothetical protein MCUN1_000741 [Malassezia cuniculi]|uniref:Uncharacterized protein n=1 Tax=Malassezia cuniculi TaxID=948313 RepID=A0AAF0J5C2_9BASI|nr:hypothetical protein MCUN1_000741 [Malassezia cuniculi]